MLVGKTVVLGVTGGIAAYKSCEIVSRLKKLGCNVEVIMTAHATEFVAPLSFEVLSGNKVVRDMFDREFKFDVEHISLAKKADLFVVAPATANVIGKIAGGIADDMLTTTIMASKAPKLICPAMNTNMLENEFVEKNISILEKQGYIFVDSTEGRLACGDSGKGKMAEPEEIVKRIVQILSPKNDLAGKKVLVTAGATIEEVDGVRYISNHSSGKMGVAIANSAGLRGAYVTLVAGKMSVPVPKTVARIINVKSTEDMLNAVMENLKDADIIVKAAAPADYTVKNKAANKIKSKDLVLELTKTPDIAKAVGEAKGSNTKLFIFSAETEDLDKNALG
jgi:phosphopantothenoylcysteine decarboxylase/phosphopantothenate--cysteine ligase